MIQDNSTKGLDNRQREMNYDCAWATTTVISRPKTDPTDHVQHPESGNCMSIFQSGSKYYLWNPIEGAIWEIVTSVDLVDIITEMGKPRFGSLKIMPIRQMSTYD
jgi:hypothetical protein